MKRILTLLMCLTLLGSTSLLTGCAGTGKAAAYKTLKTVAESVDVAMKAFTEADALGQVDSEAQIKVSTLHEQYRVAFKKAVAAARFNYETASPAEVSGLAAELATLIAAYVR